MSHFDGGSTSTFERHCCFPSVQHVFNLWPHPNIPRQMQSCNSSILQHPHTFFPLPLSHAVTAEPGLWVIYGWLRGAADFGQLAPTTIQKDPEKPYKYQTDQRCSSFSLHVTQVSVGFWGNVCHLTYREAASLRWYGALSI